MRTAAITLATALLAVAVSMPPATAADTRTWYVYCEGEAKGAHWAVFSENFWPHPMTEGYGRMVGHAAKAFFEDRHDVTLAGCAAVNFVDTSVARHSRARTAQLHQRMGDRVMYFPLPSEALPEEIALVPVLVTGAMRSASADLAPVARATVAGASTGSASESAFKLQRAER